MVRLFYIVRHYMKRMMRNRPAAITALMMPVICGALLAAVPSPGFQMVFRWVGLMLCSFFTLGWVTLLSQADKNSGLTEAIRQAPISDGQILGARVMTAAAVLVVQVALLCGVACLNL